MIKLSPSPIEEDRSLHKVKSALLVVIKLLFLIAAHKQLVKQFAHSIKYHNTEHSVRIQNLLTV